MRSAAVRAVAGCALLGFQALRADGQTSPASLAPCRLAGRVSSNGTPLPGVALTASAPDRAEPVASSTGLDGTYRLDLPHPGAYAVRAQLAGFAEVAREVALGADDCQANVDLEMVLLSRSPRPAQLPAPKPPDPPSPPNARSGVRPRPAEAPASRAAAAGRRFEGLSLVPDATTESQLESAAATPDATLQSLLPPGFSPDAPTDSVAMTGTQVQTVDALLFRERLGLLDEVGGDLEALRRRIAEGGLPGVAGMGPGLSGPGGPGGPGGMGPGGGMGGGFRDGPGGMMGRGNRVQGSVVYTLTGSPLDASPYALNGQSSRKAEYFQNRLGATLGGPLKIPGVYDGKSKTSFFLTYSGNRSHSPHDAYSTVPTLAEREGNFSASDKAIVDPATGLAFPGNVIPTSRIDQAAHTLLQFMPLPNAPGGTRNYHYVTSVENRTDEVSLRVTHAFGTPESVPGSRAPGGRMARQGGPLGRRRTSLSAGLTYRSSSRDDSTNLPSLGGATRTSAWGVPISFSFSRGRLFNQLRLDYSRNRSEGLNLYAYSRDVAGEAGINGVSRIPFDWGVPNLSFTTIADLRDRNPAMRLDQRIFVSDTITRTWGRHTLRLGGDYRWQRIESRTDTNARGSFVFTGAYTARVVDGRAVPGTGLDFADFLLGLPQQASVQYGPGRVRFDTSSWSLFLQDDWRLSGRLTLNLGVRYEMVSPYEEQSQRLVNLDVTPDFTAAAPVVSGESGPYTGAFPAALVYADRNNVAPRIGVAWKPRPNLTVRSGIGVNYNLGAYGAIAQRLSGQPPFAVSSTSLASRELPLTLTDPFADVSETTTTNSFGIEKQYQLGSVAIWNLDVQHEMNRSWILAIGYTGTRGWNLDLQRAPNRGPTGLRIPDVVPFLWQSSEGHSIMHSMTARVRRRFARGVSFGVAYTFAKAIDDASSIGGGATVVAQDDQDLAAERGRSSFDRRHRLAADSMLELPFGPGRRWLDAGALASIFGGWTWSGSLTIESGPPFTARVVGDFADVARGVNGTLRADVTGEPTDVDNPTTDRWFNTGAFVVPKSGTFGSAGRNTVTGPGTCLANMSLVKNVRLGGTRVLSVQVRASNVFNTPQFTSIDTVVNSPTYGQVVGVGPMRSVQVQTRLRF